MVLRLAAGFIDTLSLPAHYLDSPVYWYRAGIEHPNLHATIEKEETRMAAKASKQKAKRTGKASGRRTFVEVSGKRVILHIAKSDLARVLKCIREHGGVSIAFEELRIKKFPTSMSFETLPSLGLLGGYGPRADGDGDGDGDADSDADSDSDHDSDWDID
jgi:hypothetical protein